MIVSNFEADDFQHSHKPAGVKLCLAKEAVMRIPFLYGLVAISAGFLIMPTLAAAAPITFTGSRADAAAIQGRYLR